MSGKTILPTFTIIFAGLLLGAAFEQTGLFALRLIPDRWHRLTEAELFASQNARDLRSAKSNLLNIRQLLRHQAELISELENKARKGSERGATLAENNSRLALDLDHLQQNIDRVLDQCSTIDREIEMTHAGRLTYDAQIDDLQRQEQELVRVIKTEFPQKYKKFWDSKNSEIVERGDHKGE